MVSFEQNDHSQLPMMVVLISYFYTMQKGMQGINIKIGYSNQDQDGLPVALDN